MDLKEYLRIVLEMEEEIFFQTQSIEKLKETIKPLGIHKQIKKPDSPKTSIEDVWDEIVKAIFSVFVTVVIWFLWKSIRQKDFFLSNFFGVILFIVGLVAILFSLGFLFIAFYEISDYIKKTEQTIYERKIAEYNALIDEDNVRVSNELLLKEHLEAELKALESQNEASKKTLEEIYSKNVIFPKYRNWVMVSLIYEYISSGRKKTLGEAYDTLEIEFRMERIIFNLNRIVQSLEEIKENQYMLYQSINSVNIRLERILSVSQSIVNSVNKLSTEVKSAKEEIEALKCSSYFLAYNSERTQKELSYLNRMKYLSGDFDGIPFNAPPST